MTINNPFQALSARLEFPESSTLSEVLALPVTPSSLAARCGLTETSISGGLHDLYMLMALSTSSRVSGN